MVKYLMTTVLVFALGIPAASTPNKNSEQPVKIRIPSPSDILVFKANPVPPRSHFPKYKITRKTINEVLTKWHQVTKAHWHHGYSHIAGENRTGFIKLRNGTTISWMVKPGGLATLSLPKGKTVHLAKELTRWKRKTTSKR